MNTKSRHSMRARWQGITRFDTALFLAVSILISLGWVEHVWGQTDVKRVGILSYSEIVDETEWGRFFKLFRKTLADRGWIEGKNVTFELRSAHRDPSQFGVAARALIDSNVDVIWAWSAPALRAAHAATRAIPIVGFDYTADPIAEGYVESYSRPGGNITGVFLDAPELAGKWFELLQAMIPNLSRVAVLWDPAPGATHLHAARSVAKSLDINLQVMEVRKPDDINRVFAAIGESQAIIILPSPMIYNQKERIAGLTLMHGVPAISFAHTYAEAGGVIAYGPDDNAGVESLTVLIAKILDGADPAVLPVERPTKVRLVVNMKSAKALGITIPQSILLRADEVIR